MTAAGRIVVRETVDEAHLRVPREYGGDIDDRDAAPVVGRNDRERAHDRRHVRRLLALHRRDHHVFAARPSSSSFVEQVERLADAGGVPEKDLELTAVGGALGGFDPTEQRFRIARGLRAHRCYNKVPRSTTMPTLK